jgi:ketosteroid isomerase-like protein
MAPPPAVSPPAAPVVAPTANADAEIRAAVQSYARAIDSRDVAEVRRANPGLTDDQQHAFDLFFQNVRTLHTSLTVLSSNVNGNSAEAQLSGTYDYQTADGQSHHQQERYVATLRRDGGVWKLAAVR